jgi:hypothetical protein
LLPGLRPFRLQSADELQASFQSALSDAGIHVEGGH